MGYKILHGHAYAAPKGKRSYISLGGTFSTIKKARAYAKKQLSDERFRYVPSSKVKKTKFKQLYYIGK